MKDDCRYVRSLDEYAHTIKWAVQYNTYFYGEVKVDSDLIAIADLYELQDAMEVVQL